MEGANKYYIRQSKQSEIVPADLSIYLDDVFIGGISATRDTGIRRVTFSVGYCKFNKIHSMQ